MELYSIWSTDWYQNREHSIKRVLKAIEDSKNPRSIISDINENELKRLETPDEPNEIISDDLNLRKTTRKPKYLWKIFRITFRRISLQFIKELGLSNT